MFHVSSLLINILYYLSNVAKKPLALVIIDSKIDGEKMSKDIQQVAADKVSYSTLTAKEKIKTFFVRKDAQKVGKFSYLEQGLSNNI